MILFDAEAFRSINNLAGRVPALDAVGIFSARWLIVLMFLVVAARAVAAARRPSSRGVAALFAAAEFRAFVAAASAFVGNWLFSLLVFRPRPFVALMGTHLLVPKPLTPHAFPSGHSSAAFALAFTMLLVDLPFGLLLLVCAGAVAVGRVFVGVHYPMDVVAGIFVGLFWALVMHVVGVRLHDVEFLKRHLKPRSTRKI
jgi:undecaprenyl-diphosphatase